MLESKTVHAQWVRDDADRQGVLDRARFCAELTKPWYLPPQGQDSNAKLPETFSSLAARGITNLEGRLLLALYPPGMPWFSFRPSGKFLYDPNIVPEQLQQFEAHLQLHELMVLSKLEAASVNTNDNTRRGGFRSRKRTAISQLLITGDVLERVGPDYRIQVYPRDAYVTTRDASGDVLYHICREEIDPAVLNDSQLETINIDREALMAKPVGDRMEDLFTRVEWQPVSRTWVITQEVKEKTVLESEEPITPYISTPYELAPGENYGRGLIELNLGDVRSMNELTERLLDFAAMSSKQLYATDYNSQVRPQDLAQESGSVIQAKVQGGQVTDVGVLRADKVNDFTVVQSVRESIRRDLSVTMLMEGETQPTGERVTAYQIQRIAKELEGALGGVYAPIADFQQVPLVERVVWQMREEGLLPPLPADAVEVETVTGVAALGREAEQGRLVNALGLLAQLGPETLGRIDKKVLLDMIFRQSGIYEPGLVKSDEQLQQEQQLAMQQQQATAASDKMIDTAGNIAQSEAAAAAQQNTGRQQ